MKLFIGFIVHLSTVLNGGDTKYPISAIPEHLKENVDAVVRVDHIQFKILAMNRATYHVHKVVTIFNEKGSEQAKKIILYDRLQEIVDIKAYVFDAAGKQLRRLKKLEVYDQSLYDGITLFSDSRIKVLDLKQGTYPYTVEFDYEVIFKFLYYIPSSWWGEERVSYQNASYQLVFPKELKPRYQLFNRKIEPIKESLDENFISLTWILKDVKPIKIEPNGPPEEEVIPHIIAAPTEFQFEKYSGRMKTWEDFGLWINKLNVGRDVLPDETKRQVKGIIADLKTDEEKIKALYEFMQNKTRYVSIQLGIGGFQPFEASVVDKYGYGDCKALSNYMIALLKEANIPANYILISAGNIKTPMNVDFPSTQFNHAIVAVPNNRDTIWLECTSQTNPFGYQGKFTEDRKALMITAAGGKVVNTTCYTPEQNILSRTALVVLDDTGNAKTKIRSTYSGLQIENDGLIFKLNNADDQKKWIEENTEIPNFNINSFSMTEIKNKIPSAIVTLDLTLNRYASVSGKRLFVSPNLMNKVTYVPPKATERKTDLVLKTNAIDLDTIQFSIPENLYPEFLPEPVKINSKFGEYEASFQFDAGKVTYVRRMKIWKGRFPKEAYNEFVDFYKNVGKADNIKLVFLNKT